MNYKTHINGGLLAGLYVTIQMTNMPILSKGILLGSAFVGSVLPDIDHTKSYVGKKVKPVSKAINKIAGHRKLFHAPLAYLLGYSVSIGMVSNSLGIIALKGVFLGILTHLILDSFTIGGLPWFYPLSKKKFSLAKIKTSSRLEDLLCGILVFTNILIALDMLHITSIFTFTQK